MAKGPKKTFRISGRVVDRKTRQGVGGLRVEAWDKDLIFDDLVGSASTDAEGAFHIEFDQSYFKELFLDRQPDLFFKVFRDDTLLKSTENSVLWNVTADNTEIVIEVDMLQSKESGGPWQVKGQIHFDNGLPARNIVVRLYHKGFGGLDTRLGETETNAQGSYAFVYEPSIKAPVNLEVRIADAQGKEISLSATICDASRQEVLNLVAPSAGVQPLAPEYRRLSNDLAGYIGGLEQLAGAREDAERQDITLLHKATGWDARLIVLAALAVKYSAETGLSQEALYALFRTGLPNDPRQLAGVSVEAVGKALSKATETGLVRLDATQISAAKTAFEVYARPVRKAETAPGALSSLDELLDKSELSKTERDVFAELHFTYRHAGVELWRQAQAHGIPEQKIKNLQLQGKLAYLTLNNAALTESLQTDIGSPDNLTKLVGKGTDFYKAEAWETRINTLVDNKLPELEKLAALGKLIPPAYTDEKTVDRLRAYAADLARKVRLSFPTQVIGRMIERDELRLGKDHAILKAPVQSFLQKATSVGYELGRTPIDAFINNHKGTLFKAGLSDKEIKDQTDGVRLLQRLYQITPSNESLQALFTQGFTSAYEVVSVPYEVFLERFGSVFSSREEAQLVYRKAQQVSSVTYSFFTAAKLLDSALPLYAMSPLSVDRGKAAKGKLVNLAFSLPDRVKDAKDQRIKHYPAIESSWADRIKAAKDNLIEHYPTMEALFGSLDFCECEHCRSVLSPAAYFVDLLQFINPEDKAWKSFTDNWASTHPGKTYNGLKPYDALIARRPDLPYLPLTCENTNTDLPYIDLVNEILEYYVANGKLEDKAAYDTGEAATAELLAEPQNVISEAYDKVRGAHYPLSLPFDLWLETVRRFLGHCDAPLWRVLEIFRPSHELFVPAQPFDRFAIFMESFGLSPVETAIFTDTDPLAKWFELYGFTTAAIATTEVLDATTGQRIDLNSAKTLSRRLGVTYKEILEIVQTGFVNPKLTEVVLLYKLGVSIQDARLYKDHKPFYEQNKDLIGKDRSSLPSADQMRFDALSNKVANTQWAGWEIVNEVAAFEGRLENLATAFNVQLSDLQAYVRNLPFEKILLLADPNTGCNFDLTTLQYADGTKAEPIVFLRINLFVRLWRKLGWSIEETDRALQVFVPKNAPYKLVEGANPNANLGKQPLKSALIYLAHLKALDAKIKVGKQNRLMLLTLWSDIATTGKNPLYAQLFLASSVLKCGEVTVIANGQSRLLSVFNNSLGQYLRPAELTTIAEQVVYEARLQGVTNTHKINAAAFASEQNISFRYDVLRETQYLTYLGVLSDSEKTRLTALSPSAELSELLNAVQARGKEFTFIKGHVLALQGTLGLTADEIGCILADADKSIETAELSLANVSLLYRYGLLGKGLNLSVRELIALKQLSGLDPFTQLHPDPLADTPAGIVPAQTAIELDYPFTQTLRFVELAEEVKDSGFKIEDLDYLLRHRFDETGKYRPNHEGTLVLLKTLADGVRAIRVEYAVPDDPDTLSDEVLRQKLGLALPPDVVATFLAMMNGTAEFTATKAVASANQLKPEEFTDEPSIRQVSYNSMSQEQKLTFRGVLFDAQKNDLKGKLPKPVPPNQHVPSPDLGELLDGVQQQAQSFFDRHLLKQAAGVQPASGFLDTAENALLFAAIPGGLSSAEQQAFAAMTEKEQQAFRLARERQKRTRLAQAFLPFLQQRLIRQFIVQTMTAQMAADPVLVESLITDKRLLTGLDSMPLLASFTSTGERGVSAAFFDSNDGSGLPQATTRIVRSADTSLKDNKDTNGNPLTPAKSARFEGYLEVPTPGAYRFYIELDQQNAIAELRFNQLANPVFLKNTAIAANFGKFDNFLELKAGVLYRFSLDLTELNGGEARLLVRGETLPKGPMSQLTLYPAAAIDAAERATLLLTKVLQLAQSLGLSEREIRYLLTDGAGAFENPDFDTLPLRDAQDTLDTIAAGKMKADNTLSKKQAIAQGRNENPDLASEADLVTPHFKQFLRLVGYARLKRDLAGGSDDLIGIFETNDIDQVYRLIAKMTRRDKTTVQATAKALFTTPRFKNELTLQRVWDALQVVERLGVPVDALVRWATPAPDFAIARDLKNTVKSRYESENWQRIAPSIFDPLRQAQRDALVAYVLHTHPEGFESVNQLFEYFLIDPGMEPVVHTSRLRLAISSVQLFIQRCLLNLEPQVSPSAISSPQWQWMKRYRTWEANRKIFLYPENWLEPEFRDDKTHLFEELEGALLQGDISNDLAEDAFFNYLKKLEQLARLDIVSLYCEEKPNDPASNTLHVIGRTFSLPHKYYYRRYALQAWTPWEPVTTEIEGDHVVAVIWRERLHLFWVTFLEKGSPDPSSQVRFDKNTTPGEIANTISSSSPKKQVEVQLNWTEYFQGQWTARESGGFGDPIRVDVENHFNSRSVFIHVSKEDEGRAIKIHLSGADFNTKWGGWTTYTTAFRVVSKNSPPEIVNRDEPQTPPYPYSQDGARATRYHASGPLQVSLEKLNEAERGKTPQDILHLDKKDNFSLLTCSNPVQHPTPELAPLVSSFFYQDNLHTLFVEPTLTEPTIPNAESYGVLPAVTGQIWVDAKWWQDIPIDTKVPDVGPAPDPDPRSRFSIISTSDWVTDPSTVLQFGRSVIGQGGGVDISVLTGGGKNGAPNSADFRTGSPATRGVAFTKGVNLVSGSGLNAVVLRNLKASSGGVIPDFTNR